LCEYRCCIWYASQRLHSLLARMGSSTPAPGAAPPRGPHVGEPDFVPSLAAVTEAHKLAKSAASSLTFEDVHTSVRLLGEALALLTRPPPAR